MWDGKKVNFSANEFEWLEKLHIRPDLTYTTPRMNQQKYLGKVSGENRYAQKRYFLQTLEKILDILHARALVKIRESFNSKLWKEVKIMFVYMQNVLLLLP